MECRIAIHEILPPDAYLASRYYDAHRGFMSRRVYYENGLIEAFDGIAWWKVCQFTKEQVQQAKQIVLESGLTDAAVPADKKIFDTAVLSYAWQLGTMKGQFDNRLYPAVVTSVVEELENKLDKLETGAINKSDSFPQSE